MGRRGIERGRRDKRETDAREGTNEKELEVKEKLLEERDEGEKRDARPCRLTAVEERVVVGGRGGEGGGVSVEDSLHGGR